MAISLGIYPTFSDNPILYRWLSCTHWRSYLWHLPHVLLRDFPCTNKGTAQLHMFFLSGASLARPIPEWAAHQSDWSWHGTKTWLTRRKAVEVSSKTRQSLKVPYMIMYVKKNTKAHVPERWRFVGNKGEVSKSFAEPNQNCAEFLMSKSSNMPQCVTQTPSPWRCVCLDNNQATPCNQRTYAPWFYDDIGTKWQAHLCQVCCHPQPHSRPGRRRWFQIISVGICDMCIIDR